MGRIGFLYYAQIIINLLFKLNLTVIIKKVIIEIIKEIPVTFIYNNSAILIVVYSILNIFNGRLIEFNKY